MAKLTKRAIEALEASDKDYLVWNSRLSAYGARVFPTDRKQFVLRLAGDTGYDLIAGDFTFGRAGSSHVEGGISLVVAVRTRTGEGDVYLQDSESKRGLQTFIHVQYRAMPRYDARFQTQTRILLDRLTPSVRQPKCGGWTLRSLAAGHADWRLRCCFIVPGITLHCSSGSTRPDPSVPA
ncbi:hypothetical protein GGQ88_002831 [Novosphingobium hassiacum]|uniref:Uncharacterized protein n=1 Tax=Novosphingobium hassiacum TaxID=173676 RepID=A0A7W6A075_9SPHN|nr:hypothetical protein [Novosphingobium hassiacum]MBB3861547.1 hypothetical protein [Novosphingobium hassiacum]